jgi:hypothetical protein
MLTLTEIIRSPEPSYVYLLAKHISQYIFSPPASGTIHMGSPSSGPSGSHCFRLQPQPSQNMFSSLIFWFYYKAASLIDYGTRDSVLNLGFLKAISDTLNNGYTFGTYLVSMIIVFVLF